MSRFYRIELTNQDGQPVRFASFSRNAATPTAIQIGGQSIEPGVITSLLPDKKTTNASALDVEFDIEQNIEAVGTINSFVRVYGLDLRDIYRTDFNPQRDKKKWTNITVEVGMADGLPLAKHSQAGVVVKGMVSQAFGNWLGVDMTLDLVMEPSAPPAGTHDDPRNYVFDWKKGQKLADAIKETIDKSPLSGLTQDFSAIADDRTANADKPGIYDTFTDFSQAVRKFTAKQRSDSDEGVLLTKDGIDVSAMDISNHPETFGKNPKNILFEDVLGQVTWYAPYEMTCKVVMRGDLRILGFVKFPEGVLVQTQSTAMTGMLPDRDRNKLGILSGGTFMINRIHHWGRYRQPDAMSWNTTLGLSQIRR